MKNFKLIFIACMFVLMANGQNFTYSGYVYNADGTGAINVPVKLYKRTTPTLTGFTSQNNYNGHSYYRSTGSMTWTNAKAACLNMGGHLVTVTTAAENTFIFNLWPSGWIGLTDEVTEGQWRWVTGETFSWANWNGGEPNNSNNEDYIQFVGGGKWNDLPNVSLPYVLEFEYIVDYTAWAYVKTVYTDVTGRYVVNEVSNPATEWYLKFDAPVPVSSLSLTDIQSVASVILKKFALTGVHYYQYDINGDGNIRISDAVYLNGKRYSLLATSSNSFVSKYFTVAEYNAIKLSVNNLKTTYPGTSSITVNSPVSGGTANYYLIAPGYKGTVTY